MANVMPITRRAPLHAPTPAYTREEIETLVEQLIGVLDDMDGDCDLEPNLGWVTQWNGVITSVADTDDREVDHDFY